MIDILNQAISQADFARLVDRTEGRVSQWVSDGTLQPGATALEWLHCVINRLSDGAAGRASDGVLDLSQERAALAKAQREGVEIKNAVQRGEYAAVSLLAQTLATASQAVAERFDHLPGRVRKRCPLLPAAALEQVLTVIGEARNDWARATVELVAARMERDDDEAGDDTTEAAEPT